MEVSPEVAGEDAFVHRVVHEIDWDAYASQYDLLATNNPAYRENIEILREVLVECAVPEDAAVCDIGAGTGNFVCALAKDLPRASFFHVDADERMNDVARRKYDAAGMSNVEVLCCSAEDLTFPLRSLDLIVCVNVLYAIPSREDLLRKVRSWLKPGGVFFVIDFGRKNRMWDWAKYIFGNIYREKGIAACFRFLFGGLETIRQNRRGAQGQAEGVYWLHNTNEFVQTLEGTGFRIERIQTCYRGYCDLAVCRPEAR